MRRVEAKVDEKGDGHSILEPLHHIGLAVKGVGHVASQDDVLSCTCRHKLGFFSHSVGTWENSIHRPVRSTIKGDLQSVAQSQFQAHTLEIQVTVSRKTMLQHLISIFYL